VSSLWCVVSCHVVMSHDFVSFHLEFLDIKIGEGVGISSLVENTLFQVVF
jgi:hypothetical protein